MKRLADHSQYFLRSPRLVKELVGHTTIKKSDMVIDIGAGSGVITSVLATRAGRVVAYESEPRAATKLRVNMAKYDNVEIIEKNFLEATLPDVPYKIFANIPFHLSSPILRKLTEASNPPAAICLIVQKQFANKLLIEKDGFTGLLGAMIAPLYTARVRKRLQKTDYWPHPAVDTVMIELLRRDEALVPTDRMEAWRAFVTDCFSTPKIYLSLPLSHVSIKDDMKPSQLNTEQWLNLFAAQTRY